MRKWIVAMVLVVLGFVLGIGCQRQISHPAALPSEPVSEAAVGFGPYTFVNLAKQVEPAVVNIDIVKHVTAFPDIFSPFFNGGPATFTQRGVGSGFIIDPSGLILTNNHVVEGHPSITVTLSNGRSYRGTVLGADPPTDVALVRISAHGLPSLQLGDSAHVQVGQWVMAVGSPLGLSKTVTSGIISSLNRQISLDERDSFIQTDAAINPGNSGGPLVDLSGQAIGMNTAIAAGATGIGFAIPASILKNVVHQLETRGHVERPWLGVAVVPIPPQYASQLPGVKHGIVVYDVVSGSPADHAGLQRGDVLEAIDGKALDTPQQLINAMNEAHVGQVVRLRVYRNGQVKTLSIRLQEAPPNAFQQQPQ